jgi:hypothetical protein
VVPHRGDSRLPAAPGAISGTLVNFPVASQFHKGGTVVDMQTWPMDSGQGGVDDRIAFITNLGEAVVYEGTDPASAATWRFVGTFDISPPTDSTAATNGRGDNITMRFGPDVLLCLRDGIASLRALVQGDLNPYEICAKVRPLLAGAPATLLAASNALVGNATFVCQMKMAYLHQQRRLLFIVPTGSTTVQASPNEIYSITTDVYAMNTETGAWMKWTGMNILDVVDTPTGMYFIDGSLKVYKYDGTATSDNGTAITFECRQAYNYLNSPANKQVTVAQPMLYATGNFSADFQMDADFNGGTISSYPSVTIGSPQVYQPQMTQTQYGRALAPHFKGQTTTGVVSWYSTNVSYIPSGGPVRPLIGPLSSRARGGEFIPRQSFTTTWSSTSGTAPAIGNGTLTADYEVRGKVAHINIKLTAGSTTTFGNAGTWRFSLPVTASRDERNGHDRPLSMRCFRPDCGFGWSRSSGRSPPISKISSRRTHGAPIDEGSSKPIELGACRNSHLQRAARSWGSTGLLGRAGGDLGSHGAGSPESDRGSLQAQGGGGMSARRFYGLVALAWFLFTLGGLIARRFL